MEKRIENLDSLVKVAGVDTTNKIFTEYMMNIIAKSRKYDAILKKVNSGCSIDDIKDILNGDDFDEKNIFN